MPILEYKNKNILFIHIPKAGGTSIEDWLAQQGNLMFYTHNPRRPFNCSPQHMTWRDIQFLFCNKKWDYSFSIVRNPYERMESEFAYRHRDKLELGRQTLNFSNWVEKSLDAVENNPYYMDNHFRPQHEYLAEDVSIFHLEDGLENILQTVSKETGLECPESIPHKNQRKGRPNFDWSSQLLTRFNEFYKDDFELLGYEKRTIKTRRLKFLKGF